LLEVEKALTKRLPHRETPNTVKYWGFSLRKHNFNKLTWRGDNMAETFIGKALRFLNLQKDISDYPWAY
jgi:hypothetical protein